MIIQQAISGRVTRVGYYGDTLPKLIITIPKSAAGGLFVREGERMNLQLSLNGEAYLAGIRTSSKAKTLTICPDLLDKTGTDNRLTDLLLQHNIQQKTNVVITINATGIVLTP